MIMRWTHSRFCWVIVLVVLLTTAGVAFAIGVANTNAAASVYAPMDVVLLISYILLALVFSFLCSVAEAVLLSVTPSYTADLGKKQPKKAALLKRLKQENLDQSLAAILTLNTIAHTVGRSVPGRRPPPSSAAPGSGCFRRL